MPLVALVLGLLGVVVPFLPIPLDLARPWTAVALGLLGFIMAIIALLGHGRGKPMAAIGALLSLLALLVGAIMLGNALEIF